MTCEAGAGVELGSTPAAEVGLNPSSIKPPDGVEGFLGPPEMQPGKNRSRICYYDWERGTTPHILMVVSITKALYRKWGCLTKYQNIHFKLVVWASRMISSNLSFARMSGLYLRGFIFVAEDQVTTKHPRESKKYCSCLTFRFKNHCFRKDLPSLKLTYPLNIDHWKRRFLLETIIFKGYVSFRKDLLHQPFQGTKSFDGL